ncbi:MAG TPA: DNA polymerase III subunit delta [Anaerolineaceae bacterium]|jgi:DNA polymerase-3 subunit delta|nr:DNA polymerase III subunit delta [Anaerolineaceae bacterium]HPS32709.1 DNA polymerase III subunit delta [Anaerolineaceae bacterium]
MELARLTVLRGDDGERVQALLAEMTASLGDPQMAEMNTTVLDSESLNLESLRADCLTMPFLAERRLVLVRKARPILTKLNSAERNKALEILAELPETAALVLVIEDSQAAKRGEKYWENARAYTWLLDWLGAHAEFSQLIDCALPDDAEMPGWIAKYARKAGGEFRTDAAHLLASYVGNNTLRATQEITKLLTYVNGARAVNTQDVVLLTSQEQEGNIFNLVDALGERNGSKAMTQFRILSEKNEMIELSGMIYRQFRLLIQAREILDEGGGSRQVEKELRVLPFVADKLTSQARRFTMAQLLDVFGRLLRIDEDMKSSGMPGEVAFELLIAELTA